VRKHRLLIRRQIDRCHCVAGPPRGKLKVGESHGKAGEDGARNMLRCSESTTQSFILRRFECVLDLCVLSSARC
jgi:hypothetical protein